MANWQYAWLTDQPFTTIGFSHPQPGLAAELAGVLGPGVMIQQSSEWSISLDRTRVNLGYVSGLMGDRGWEMFAVETRLQPNAMVPSQLQTNWYFKRPAPATATGAAMAVGNTSQPMQPSGSMGSMGAMGASISPAMSSSPATAPAPAMAAPPMYAAPAIDAAPATAAPPAMPAPPAMSAPAGPEQASMSGAATPPAGPEGAAMPSSSMNPPTTPGV